MSAVSGIQVANQAVRRIFATEGYAGASIRSITRSLEVRESAFYVHGLFRWLRLPSNDYVDSLLPTFFKKDNRDTIPCLSSGARRGLVPKRHDSHVAV
jgi:hypothetical protein